MLVLDWGQKATQCPTQRSLDFLLVLLEGSIVEFLQTLFQLLHYLHLSVHQPEDHQFPVQKYTCYVNRKMCIQNAQFTRCFSIPSLASSMIFSTSSIENSFCTSFNDSFPTFKLSRTRISTCVNSRSWTSCSTRSSCLSVLSISCSWYLFFFSSSLALLNNKF